MSKSTQDKASEQRYGQLDIFEDKEILNYQEEKSMLLAGHHQERHKSMPRRGLNNSQDSHSNPLSCPLQKASVAKLAMTAKTAQLTSESDLRECG